MSAEARVLASFTAPVSCAVTASAGFEAQGLGSASDWGTGWGYHIVISQYASSGGSLLDSDQSTTKPVTSQRAKYIEMFSADVVAGRYIEVVLRGSNGPGLSTRFWNIESRVEVIKR